MNSIAILGCGALGGLFGGLLREAGFAVCFIDVDDVHIGAIRDRGLRLTTDAGDRCISAQVGRAADFQAPVDVLFVFTKTHHTVQALDSVRHLIGADTWAVTLQNGLGAGSRLATAVPRERVAIGMTTWPAELTAPGHITSRGSGKSQIWSLSGDFDPALLEIARGLDRAGLRCTADESVAVAIWEKAAFNAAMNSLAAVSGMSVGEMADSPQIRAVARAVVSEAVATAQAAGIRVDDQRIWDTVEMAYSGHREHRPSMLQDVLAGRKTEIDSINGAIVAEAIKLGLDVPATALLALLVRAKESPGA